MLKKIKPKSEFSRHVLTLMTGTTIAQVIPIAISPILTRLYSPGDFGILALYMSILMIIGIFATGRYEFALPMSRRIKDANNIIIIIISILSFISVLMLMILFVFSEFISSMVSAEMLVLLYIMPINIILVGLFNAMQYWLNRAENFKKIASNKVMLNVLIATFQIAIGFSALNEYGLILGYIFGYAILLIYIVIQAKNVLIESLGSISYRNMKYNLIKYKDFPLVNAFHSLSDKIQSDGVIFIISYKFGFAILGFYSMSLRVITTPAGLMGDAVGQVVFSKYSKLYNETKNIQDEVKSILKKLFLFATPLFAILFFILPSLFSFVFGEEWQEAGTYAQILLPYIYLSFIISPVARVPLIVNKIKRYFTFSLTWNLISITIFATTSFISNDFILSLSLFSLSRVIYTLLLLRWIINISRQEKN